MNEPQPIRTLGWREWLALPDFAIACIQAKVDPEVSISQLHAVKFCPIEVKGEPWMRFHILPVKHDPRTTLAAEAPLAPVQLGPGADPVIRTAITVGGETWSINIQLVSHDLMGYRMLLGSEAIEKRFEVDATHCFLAGPPLLGTPPHRPTRSRRTATGGRRSNKLQKDLFS
jgi:hypothetical protein